MTLDSRPGEARGRPVVEVRGLWKRFDLHRESQRSLQESFIRVFRRERRDRAYFWPLRDISLTVHPQECVAIIGPNGSGKSTLLKILAGVLEPTSGEVIVRGRVGALLELGAGFHPDLTGRENIYLNGAIVGLSRAEIRNKLDDIVGFAEIEDFVDVPVKHYSSGMYVRLGFSVAVHSDPELLLVDEVLAVGDQGFQAKCIRRVAELRRSGVTVLLVTHDLALVGNFCTRAIWLEDGEIQIDDIPEPVVTAYVRRTHDTELSRLQQANEETAEGVAAESTTSAPAEGVRRTRYGNGRIRITRVEMLRADGSPSWVFCPYERVRVRLHYEVPRPVETPVFSLLIHREDGLYVSGSNTYQSNEGEDRLPAIAGRGWIDADIPSLGLGLGAYLLSVGAYAAPDPPYWADPADYHDRLYRFNIESDQHVHGVLAVQAEWRLGEDGAA